MARDVSQQGLSAGDFPQIAPRGTDHQRYFRDHHSDSKGAFWGDEFIYILLYYQWLHEPFKIPLVILLIHSRNARQPSNIIGWEPFTVMIGCSLALLMGEFEIHNNHTHD